MKTPEEMAMNYIKDVETARNPSITTTAFPQLQRCFLAGYKAAQDQLADTSKVMCNTTMEEVKAVDTGELMPITNLPTSAKWISVKDRLPEDFEDVLTFEDGECYRVNSISQLTKYWWDSDEGFERHPTHWMPLPEPPKEEK